MKTIEVKRQLLEEALDQLKGAQQDCYVLSTQNVIDELEVVLRQPDVIKSVCQHNFYYNGGIKKLKCANCDETRDA